MRRPARRSVASASGVLALMGSATASNPANRPSTARNITLAPSARSASACDSSDSIATPSCCIRRGVAQGQALARNRAAHTDPGTGFELIGPVEFQAAIMRSLHDRGCQRVFAELVKAGGESQTDFGLGEFRRCERAHERGPPFGQRAGLVDDQRIDLCAVARSPTASRNSTPCMAPRPVATMMDMGVARPSAQGQAMISTATALTSPKTQRGSGPKRPQ